MPQNAAEPPDPELIRVVLLHLTQQERSPPEAIFISAPELGAQWRTGRDEVARALEFLSSRGLIEGPGWFRSEFYLFRKLTAQGRALARAIERPRDWSALKARYLA